MNECSHAQIGETGDNPRGSWGLINESGLFALVLTSRKARGSRKFRRWVTSDVFHQLGAREATAEQPAPDPASRAQRHRGHHQPMPRNLHRHREHKNERRSATHQRRRGRHSRHRSHEQHDGRCPHQRAGRARDLSNPRRWLWKLDEGVGNATSWKRPSIRGAKVAERYVATRHRRTADAEIPPVGLPR